MGEKLLVSLGRHPYDAHRSARMFKSHDEALIRKAARHVNDTDRLVAIARQGSSEIEKVLAADLSGSEPLQDHAWEAPDKTRE